MRAAIYIRVSTQEQAKEGFSISAQRQRLTQFAQSQDWDIVDYYVDDGVSAKDTNRPELKRMLTDIRENKIDVVLVFRLDRLTRSVLDLYKLLDTFQQHDCAFKSATEVYDTTTAIGRLFVTLVAALAQWERENLAERVRVGMEQMVLEGKWHGGVSAIGVDWDSENQKLNLNEEEAKLVKLIYKMYCYGDENTPPMGDNRLAKWLNARGFRTKKGEPWSHTSVRYVLTNPIYIQLYRWNYRSDGEYMEIKSNQIPRILDDETWHLAQKLRQERFGMHPRSATSANLFSGRLRCGRCESALKVSSRHINGKKYVYYECTKKRMGLCNLPKISEKLLEQKFLDVVKVYRDTNAAMEVAAGMSQEPDKANEIRSIQREIKKIKERRKKWQLAYAEEAITLEDLRERTAEDRLRENELLKELEELTDEKEAIPQHSAEEIASLLQDFELQWEEATRSEKKTLIQILTKSITVNSPYDNLSRRPFKDRIIEIEKVEFN